jgi:peptidoglycan/xylan/chitin deacetylase (PgdA/CDA1 family)
MKQNLAQTVLVGSVCAASIAFAGPITTVPWNGYTGAVSLTYDDGRPSQLSNLIPTLDQSTYSTIKVTFFLAGSIYTWPSQKTSWIPVAAKGHELANHTQDHSTPTSTNVTQMASALRALDPSIDAASFAYPNCTVSGTNYVSAEAFVGRGCGQATYAWGTQPSDWMNVQGLIINSGAPSPGVSLINSAKSGNSWVTTIIHDVTASPDQYSLTPADNQKILDAAKSSGCWTAPYGTVGAYYRAHFTMDAVTASGSGPWNLTWTSPHPKMPRSVPLKIKLATATFGSSFTVSQDNVAIPANSDGSYTIDFMKLKMTVTSGTTGIQDRTIYGKAEASAVGNSLRFEGMVPGDYTLSLRTLSGALLERSTFHVPGSDAEVAIPASAHGRRVLAVLDASGKDSRTLPIAIP